MERSSTDTPDQTRDMDGPAPVEPSHRALNGVHSAIQAGGRSRSDDSWIDVSSQPSSSSLSSAGAPAQAEEIITTGLRIQHDSNAQRRRRQIDRARSSGLHMARSLRGTSSSQEEYEESESESDRVMTSSNEGMAHPSPLQQEWRPHNDLSYASSDNLGDGEDSDENQTAINVGRGAQAQLSFQPQPNAFNRPPSGATQSARMYTSPSSSASRPHMRSASQRHSYPAQGQAQHTPFSAMSPSYRADQDAALRASLSTLLSCAAAARALPKPGNPSTTATSVPAASSQPTTLRIVPESTVLGTSSRQPPTTATSTDPPSIRAAAAVSPQTRSRSADKSKRRSASKDRGGTRPSKKSRRSPSATAVAGFAGGAAAAAASRSSSPYGFAGYSVDDVSPTLLTWVVSAGVVVLVGALSFSAGYAVGKEAGRVELLGGAGAGGAGCGREVVRGTGLKRRVLMGM